MNPWASVALGIVTGGLSGFLGLGGGIIMVPAMTYLFHLSQQEAQGISLAVMLPPVSLFAVMEYHKKGFVNVNAAMFIVVGFLLGSWLTASVIHKVPPATLRRFFGLLMAFASAQMVLGGLDWSKGLGRALAWSSALAACLYTGAILKKAPTAQPASTISLAEESEAESEADDRRANGSDKP